MSERQWEIIKHDRMAAAGLSSEIGVSQLVAALLIARGYDTADSAKRFLLPERSHLNDPFLLKGINEALDRIIHAINNTEKILIWGDYDVDGTTGTVLLLRVLSLCGAETEYHIPNRFTEGYGVNIEGLNAAIQRGCKLVITVDCGIRSFESLDWAAQNGLDVIVTDHHLSDPEEGNPRAIAVVNPNQPGCEYPDKDLAGVGVAFKLAHALLKKLGKENDIWPLTKFAALGTIADIMRLKGENRAIVALGLRGLADTSNHGLRALMEISDCRNDMTSYDVGFRLAPRINAAGRMESAAKVVELLEAGNFLEARKIATMLDQRNRERQQIQHQITETAIQASQNDVDNKVIIAAGENWHRGVIGLAASRIAEKMRRPAIVFSIENGVAYGSARTYGEINVVEIIDKCRDLLIEYGGHAAAAGLKLRADLVGEFTESINSLESLSSNNNFESFPVLTIDAHVSSSTMNLEVVNEIALLEPFGAGNPKPVFMTDGLRLRFDPTVMKDKHLKLYLTDDNNKNFEAVWWDGVERSKGQTWTQGKRIKLAYTPEVNSWQGNIRLQLVVTDLKEHN